MYAGRVACCPGESRCRWDRLTDGQTPDRYITLFAKRGQRNNVGDIRRKYFLDNLGLPVNGQSAKHFRCIETVITHANGSHGGTVFIAVCLFVCLSARCLKSLKNRCS